MIEGNEIDISREVAWFLFNHDLLVDYAEIRCKEYDLDNRDENDEDFVPLDYLDCLDDETGLISFADHWQTFQIWLK